MTQPVRPAQPVLPALTVVKPKNGPCHKACAEMHARGYCICTTVACIWCDRYHPPHKACSES